MDRKPRPVEGAMGALLGILDVESDVESNLNSRQKDRTIPASREFSTPFVHPVLPCICRGRCWNQSDTAEQGQEWGSFSQLRPQRFVRRQLCSLLATGCDGRDGTVFNFIRLPASLLIVLALFLSHPASSITSPAPLYSAVT